jgi:hypothetical protein
MVARCASTVLSRDTLWLLECDCESAVTLPPPPVQLRQPRQAHVVNATAELFLRLAAAVINLKQMRFKFPLGAHCEQARRQTKA